MYTVEIHANTKPSLAALRPQPTALCEKFSLFCHALVPDDPGRLVPYVSDKTNAGSHFPVQASVVTGDEERSECASVHPL